MNDVAAAAGRYARHALIDWFSQDAVRAARFAVIGAGAVGNEVVKNLVLLGVGAIDVFDFDTVELHNLTRSVLLRESDVGTAKAHAVARRARELDPGVVIEAVEGDFWDTLAISTLGRYAAVFSCVDNFEARIRLNQMCLIAGVDLVNAGIDSRFAAVERFGHSHGTGSACYECHLPESAYLRIAERYSCGWLKKRAYSERKVPTTAITASIAGGIAVSTALRLGEDAADAPARRVLLDTISGRSTTVALARNPACVACAPYAERPRLLRCGSRLAAPLFGALADRAADVDVQTSDPIVTAYACTRCGPLPERADVVFTRASCHDDRLMRCPRCAELAARIEIRDRFTLAELFERFADRALPVKYVVAKVAGHTLCIELTKENENHGQ